MLNMIPYEQIQKIDAADFFGNKIYMQGKQSNNKFMIVMS